MAEEKKYIVDGYRFDLEEEYHCAKAEMDKILTIKRGTDLKDENALRAVYDDAVLSREFVTPVGIGFLREVQRKLLRNPEHKRTIRAIPVVGRTEKKKTEIHSDEKDGTKSLLVKIRNLRIMLLFSVLIVVILFAVTAFDKNITYQKAKEAVLDEYAGWKEELESKDKELKRREKELLEAEPESGSDKVRR